MRLVIWVQHLLGTGHTVRAVALAEALVAEGASVTLVAGATPPATLSLGSLDVVNLPPVHATDASFNTIVSPSGAPYEDLAAERSAILSQCLTEARPDIFVTETFPFGRRRFRAELLPALSAARSAGAKVVASVRDVLVRKSEDKAAAMIALARQHYDLALVHSDPRFVALTDSFPQSREIEPMIRYTGFLDAGQTVTPCAQRGGVVVSAGGSTVGRALIGAALEAAAALPDVPFHILVPHALSDLLDGGPAKSSNVTVELNRPDFRELLTSAALSVSQAGYNTVLDVLAAGPRAIFVPFAQHEETEQTDRARALQDRGLALTIPEASLSGPLLREAIMTALARPLPKRPLLDTAGAARSAAILLRNEGGLRIG